MFGKVYVPIKDIGGNKPACLLDYRQEKGTCMQTYLNNQINRGRKYYFLFSIRASNITLKATGKMSGFQEEQMYFFSSLI